MRGRRDGEEKKDRDEQRRDVVTHVDIYLRV